MSANKITPLSLTVIPAQPGWFAVGPDTDESGRVIGLRQEPILAWRIETSRREWDRSVFDDATPVRIQDACDDYPLIRRPDGTFTAPYVQDFADQAQVISYFQEQADRERMR